MIPDSKMFIPKDDGFHSWMQFGIQQGWCGPPVCYTHDGLPMSVEEESQFIEEDPCIHIIRLYEDKETKESVEDDHSPTQWRNSYLNNIL